MAPPWASAVPPSFPSEEHRTRAGSPEGGRPSTPPRSFTLASLQPDPLQSRGLPPGDARNRMSQKAKLARAPQRVVTFASTGHREESVQ